MTSIFDPRERVFLDLLWEGKISKAHQYWNTHCRSLGARRFSDLLNQEFGTCDLSEIKNVFARIHGLKQNLLRIIDAVQREGDLYDSDLARLDEIAASKIDLPSGIYPDVQAGIKRTIYRNQRLETIVRTLSALGITVDAEQLFCISYDVSRQLVRARAGSGKTRTLCAKASLEIHDGFLNPDQVLVVAFNKSAADEVKKRMRDDFACPDFENARTFHSLAYQLAKPKKRLLFDEGKDPSRRAQGSFVQSLLERMLNPAFKKLLYRFFRKEITEVESLGRDLPPEKYRVFRRSLEQVSLNGERVKSAGEKFIADFFFEHDIPYVYEKIWEWGLFDQGQPYKPDFTLISNGSDFILEHWAFDPRDWATELPDDWCMTVEQYRQQIARKRMFWAKKGISLLETHTAELAGGREAFEATLKRRLEHAGIRCHRLPDEEIIRRVFQTNFQISRMAEQFLQFIQRAKKRTLEVDPLG